MRRAILVLAVGAVLLVLALRTRRAEPRPGEPGPGKVAKSSEPFATSPPKAPEKESAAVWGVVTLMGERPRRKPLRVDPACGESLLSEDLVVGPNQEVRWTLVYVTKGLGDLRFDPPAAPVRLEALGCRFVPHVLVARTGQPLELVNRDAFNHNFHGLPFENKEFNVCLPPREAVERRFPRPEIFKVKSGIQPWMSAWIGVFGHPFVAVTGEDGVYRVPDLPPGRYEITTWHEGLKSETREVGVGDVDVRLDFLLQRR